MTAEHANRELAGLYRPDGPSIPPPQAGERPVDELLEVLAAGHAAGVAWVDVELSGRLVAVWPSAAETGTGQNATSGPTRPVQPRERLAWDHYAPELREALKDLARRYPADVIADAAGELETLVALHGAPKPK